MVALTLDLGRKHEVFRHFTHCSISTPAHNYYAARARMNVNALQRRNTQPHDNEGGKSKKSEKSKTHI